MGDQLKDQETGPRLLRAMMDIGAVFHEHAIKDGDGEKLNSNEMKALIQKEFSSVLGDGAQPFEDIFKMCVGDGKELDFRDFAIAVAALSMGFKVV